MADIIASSPIKLEVSGAQGPVGINLIGEVTDDQVLVKLPSGPRDFAGGSTLPAGSVVNARGTSTSQAASQAVIERRFGVEVLVTDYPELVSGMDWSDAIEHADQIAKAAGIPLRFPGGFFGASRPYTIQSEVSGGGKQSTRILKLAAGATITFLKGDMKGVAIGPLAPISGDTSPGLILDGDDRKDVDVWVDNHGGDGVVFKRGNLSRLFIRSRFNGGRGIFCAADIAGGGNNKSCSGDIEVTGNGCAGFEIESNANGTFVGGEHTFKVTAQGNGLQPGVTSPDPNQAWNVIIDGQNHCMSIYAEGGAGSAWHKSTAALNHTFYNLLAWSTLQKDSGDSDVINYTSGPGLRTISAVRTSKLIISGDETKSGQMVFTKTANNSFSVDLAGSSAAATIAWHPLFTHSKSGVRYGRTISQGGTLSFGNIAIGATAEATKTISTGLSEALPANTVPYAAPQAAPPANIDQVAVWLTGGTNPTSDPPVIHVRVRNSTGAAVTGLSIAYNVGLVI